MQATELDLDDGQLMIDVAGPRRPPDPEPIATQAAAAACVAQAAAAAGEPVEVRVRWTQRTEITASAPDDRTPPGGSP